MLDIKRILASAPKKPEHVKLQPLLTPWGQQLIENTQDEYQPSEPLSAAPHPHPQFERERFMLLDGWWDYCFLDISDYAKELELNQVSSDNHLLNAFINTRQIPNAFEGQIRVPFSPEAPLSGVERQLKPTEVLWYQRAFTLPSKLVVNPTDRYILHFEAVDYYCKCYLNGIFVGSNRGGYTGFSFDITHKLKEGENQIALVVYDPSDTGTQLRGKQKLDRGGIWYTAQSGIWQSVWLEIVPLHSIDVLSIDAYADTGALTLNVLISKHEETALDFDNRPTELAVKVFDSDQVIASTTHVFAEDFEQLCPTAITINITKPRLWSPEDPHLYQIELTYGKDKVSSYCGFRTITIKADEQGVMRLYINHKPYFLRGVLDQGYWPDGLLTAPSDEALIFDIQTMKDMGFNMLRKHIKVECDRWYYHCDRLGMLVWQDMVSGGSPLSSWHSSYKPTFFRWSWGRYKDDKIRHFRKLSAGDAKYRNEWKTTCINTICNLKNHPSIITWVLFNEAWGQFETREATEMVRALDPSRPIDAVSGWYDQRCGDFLSVHNYFRPLEVYKDPAEHKRAFAISEFGGLTHHIPAHSSLATSYGYGSYDDIEAFKSDVRKTLAAADVLEEQGLAGFVYTQLSDVEEETNGLLTYDRRINKLEK